MVRRTGTRKVLRRGGGRGTNTVRPTVPGPTKPSLSGPSSLLTRENTRIGLPPSLSVFPLFLFTSIGCSDHPLTGKGTPRSTDPTSSLETRSELFSSSDVVCGFLLNLPYGIYSFVSDGVGSLPDVSLFGRVDRS